MYPIYRDISHWVILDEVVIHDFSDNERAIPVVNILIGTLHYNRIGMDGKVENARTPITRWITKTEFNKYRNLKRE